MPPKKKYGVKVYSDTNNEYDFIVKAYNISGATRKANSIFKNVIDVKEL